MTTIANTSTPVEAPEGAVEDRTRGRWSKRAPAPGTGPASGLVGQEPRVDLLPVEVHVDRAERAVSRRAWLGVVVVAAVVGVGVGAATATELSASSDLAAAQGETTSLLAQQSKYAGVRTVESETALLGAARAVGGSTDIDWHAYLSDLARSLPAGVSITALTVTSTSPLSIVDQPSTPLEGARVATLQITVASDAIPSVPDWTEGLSHLRGYVDSSISSITKKDDGTAYTASIELHVDDKAWDGKFTGAQR